MAKTHRSKPHQIKLSDGGKPHALAPADWHALVSQGVAREEKDTPQGRVAVLKLPFVGWIHDGALCVARIGASIKSTWLAFEREWLLSVETITEKERQRRETESFADRVARVYRERETAIFIESLDWQTNRQKRNRNTIRWVSQDQLREVLYAFGRLPESANA